MLCFHMAGIIGPLKRESQETRGSVAKYIHSLTPELVISTTKNDRIVAHPNSSNMQVWRYKDAQSI